MIRPIVPIPIPTPIGRRCVGDVPGGVWIALAVLGMALFGLIGFMVWLWWTD